MKKRKLLRNLTAFAVIAGIVAMSTLTAFADSTTTDSGSGTVTGSVGINGTILPLTISVTHQLNLSYSIDPNSGAITATPISVTNNTKVAVNVTVESLASASGGNIQFQDVMPNAENWPTLDESDSQKYIALGIKIADPTGWNTGYNTATDWAAAKTSTLFGSLPSGATGSLALVSDNGLAFNNTYTANASVVIMVNLV
jgi:hypothetical protein